MSEEETAAKIEFKDDSEKTLTLLVIVLSVVAGFIAPLIIWVLKKDSLSDTAKQIIRKLLNFELTLLCVCILFLISVLGQLLAILGAPLVWIINVVYCIMAAIAISNSSDVKFPSYEFIK